MNTTLHYTTVSMHPYYEEKWEAWLSSSAHQAIQRTRCELGAISTKGQAREYLLVVLNGKPTQLLGDKATNALVGKNNTQRKQKH